MDEWFEHSPFVGFAPWILYWVVAGSSSTWLYGGLCAVIAAFILVVSMRVGGPRPAGRGDDRVLRRRHRGRHGHRRSDREKAAFRRTNQMLTLMWGLVFALIAGAVGMANTYPDKVRTRLRDAEA